MCKEWFAIFILAVEILLIKINHTKTLRGITYAKKESRSETFADDTSIFIQRNPTYLRECVKILKQFANISGLQCNLEKSSVIPIGGNFDTSDKLCPELNLKVGKECDSETSDPEPQGKGDANLAIWQFGWSSVQQMYALLNLRRLRWRLRDVTSGTSIHGSVQISMMLLVWRKAKKPLLALCARRALGIS